jgi:hypothetical protein
MWEFGDDPKTDRAAFWRSPLPTAAPDCRSRLPLPTAAPGCRSRLPLPAAGLAVWFSAAPGRAPAVAAGVRRSIVARKMSAATPETGTCRVLNEALSRYVGSARCPSTSGCCLPASPSSRAGPSRAQMSAIGGLSSSRPGPPAAMAAPLRQVRRTWPASVLRSPLAFGPRAPATKSTFEPPAVAVHGCSAQVMHLVHPVLHAWGCRIESSRAAVRACQAPRREHLRDRGDGQQGRPLLRSRRDVLYRDDVTQVVPEPSSCRTKPAPEKAAQVLGRDRAHREKTDMEAVREGIGNVEQLQNRR